MCRPTRSWPSDRCFKQTQFYVRDETLRHCTYRIESAIQSCSVPLHAIRLHLPLIKIYFLSLSCTCFPSYCSYSIFLQTYSLSLTAFISVLHSFFHVSFLPLFLCVLFLSSFFLPPAFFPYVLALFRHLFFCVCISFIVAFAVKWCKKMRLLASLCPSVRLSLSIPIHVTVLEAPNGFSWNLILVSFTKIYPIILILVKIG
jgi:hypothetical protein